MRIDDFEVGEVVYYKYKPETRGKVVGINTKAPMPHLEVFYEDLCTIIVQPAEFITKVCFHVMDYE